MATFATKRLIEAAEKRMNIDPAAALSDETKAFFGRCGVETGNTPADMRRLGEIFVHGIYPATMTAEDIEHVREINQAFEESC